MFLCLLMFLHVVQMCVVRLCAYEIFRERSDRKYTLFTFKRQNLENRDAKIDFIHIRDAFWYSAFRCSCIRELRDFSGILL